MIEGTVVPSTNAGRYAIDDPIEGPDLTSGEVVEVYLGGQWIRGSIEHAGPIYAIEGYLYPHNVKRGYYFISSQGGACGLCEGMKVRIP